MILLDSPSEFMKFSIAVRNWSYTMPASWEMSTTAFKFQIDDYHKTTRTTSHTRVMKHRGEMFSPQWSRGLGLGG